SLVLVASNHYSEPSLFRPQPGGPAVIHLADLQPGAAPATNPDGREGALNASVVLRWEWRPGALLYLVYTRAQAPQLTMPPGEVGKLDLRAVGRAPATDVVLVKLSYWWG